MPLSELRQARGQGDAVTVPRKPADLRVRWSRKTRDLMFAWEQDPSDGHFLYGAFCRAPSGDERSLAQELEARGYDLTTLRFQIRRKAAP